MAISTFFLADDTPDWRNLIAETATGSAINVCTPEAAVVKLEGQSDLAATSAICFAGGNYSQARRVKDRHPRLTVLVYSAEYPEGEVLLAAETHFSSQKLASLV